ncbi:hypothetical protein HOE37_05840 [Candidatus Woesearchaeota archaeon]|jgi:hypothetical protein|nr:hypothetical protein [Candidatus Woesearchaeota archaeon]MBT4111355.1 hypothetical protein [Candidatus Woesearchaeota archaeon]MBT4336466.1 hypothetical protein [Candidatus Woesearchaeota archaeon]MBT4469879.1 hypothetical protein [Candidatus Woesearchaeota archaeon]MBT6744450.1 hypothetical protein [Candidatus Woesearchaeota archaeon]
MKYDVITKRPLGSLQIGFGLVYKSNGARDAGVSIDTVIEREPLRVEIIPTIHLDFNYDLCKEHLGIFPQRRPEENKDAFKIWLQETYGRIPSVAEYLFE